MFPFITNFFLDDLVFSKVKVTGEGDKRDLSAGSLLGWPQKPRLGQATARSQEFY